MVVKTKNGRWIHFGFITTYDLVSVFVYKGELANGSVVEGDAVAFAVEKDSSDLTEHICA